MRIPATRSTPGKSWTCSILGSASYETQCVFCAETEQGVAQAIIRSVIDFKRDPWPKVSDNAKDLVKRMLDPDPNKRLTALEVLGNVSFQKLVVLYLLILLVKCSRLRN